MLIMPKVDHRTKLEIIKRYRNGSRVTDIKRQLRTRGVYVTWATVKYYINKFEIGELDDKVVPELVEREDRFKTVTDQDREEIRNALEDDPTQFGMEIQRLLQERGTNVCYSTARKAIASIGFTRAKPRYCQLIRDANKLKRQVFCNMLIDTNDSFNDMIFSDETSVQLHQKKLTCYRPKGAMPPVRPIPKHPLKVHVWGGISRRGATDIIIFEGNMNAQFFTTEILGNTLLPFLRRTFRDGHRFQQDNDPKHTSKLAKKFMAKNGINWWNVWPSESCDLNPIEMVWNQMKRHLAKVRPTTKDDLIRMIAEFWVNTVTVELCNKYIDHIFKVAPVCILVDRRATGDYPNRLFPERSRGKSFRHFNDLLQDPAVQARATMLMPAF